MPIRLEDPNTRRVVICSSSLPLTLSEEDSGQVVAKGRHNHPAWVAGLGIQNKLFIGASSDDLSEAEIKALNKANCLPLCIEKEALINFDAYCKERLWPLLHYNLWDRPLLDGNYEKALYSAFESVNCIFEKAILSMFRPGDIVLIVNYQLLLVPAELRKQHKQMPIGLFIATPVSSSEYMRCLPQARQVLNGAIGANLVCVQTDSYARHCKSCCVRILNLDNEIMEKGLRIINGDISVLLNLAPLGVDVQRGRELRNCYAVMEKVNEIKKKFPAELALVLGIDLANQKRGIRHKLDAFNLFLEMFPEWQNKVS
jgi:trehalose-6-phosphate synthase